MSNSIQTRQIDLYDGQIIFINGAEVYECGNYLGGGASGAVYQATDLSALPYERLVAIKILNPIGFKLLSIDKVGAGVVVREGVGLSAAQKQGKAVMTQDNVWWLIDAHTRQIYAAYEDPNRGQLRELPLPKCIEVWGMHPFGKELLSIEVEEKLNMSSVNVVALGQHYQLPIVPTKYLKWLRSRQDFCREVSSMMQVGSGHRNIIALHEVLELVQDSKTTLFLVLELVTGGELFDRIKNGHGMSEHFARKYFCQLLSGIAHCHAKGVCHRDLKPENLLLSDSSDTAILKIADFGLSAVVFLSEELEGEAGRDRGNQHPSQPSQPHPSQQPHPLPTKTQLQQHSHQTTPSTPTFRRLRSVVGSPHYVAPEITASESAGYDGRKVDMWSAGVILYGLLAGTLPFGRDLSSCERYKRFKQWVVSDFVPYLRSVNKELTYPSWFFPSQFPPLARVLVCHLLVPEPNDRLSAEQALKHPWCKPSHDSSSVTETKNSGQGQGYGQGGSEYPTVVRSEPTPVTVALAVVTGGVQGLSVSVHSSDSSGIGSGSGSKTSPTAPSSSVPPAPTGTQGRARERERERERETNTVVGNLVNATTTVQQPPPPPPPPSEEPSPSLVTPPPTPMSERRRNLDTVAPSSSSRQIEHEQLRTNSPNRENENETKERESVRMQQQLKVEFERMSIAPNTNSADGREQQQRNSFPPR